MMIRLTFAVWCVVAIFLGNQAAFAQVRQIPAPIVGITFDNVGSVAAKVNTLRNIVKVPTVRVVFDMGVLASSYALPIKQFRQNAFILGELADSSYMSGYTVNSIRTMTTDYANALGSLVDVWEIGNEVNGDWLGTDVMAKIQAMYDVISAGGGGTALTFFYEGEASEPNNCIDSQGGMFPWISRNFLTNPTSDTERIRLGVNYVLISWYPTQCKGGNPNWPTVFTHLSQIFPNSWVGFGEIGTPHPQNGSDLEKNLITTYYSMKAGVGGLPAKYISGVFWWYGAETLVPWDRYGLGAVLNAAIQ